MDITGIDIAAVATLVGSIGTAVAAVVKALQAGRKAEAADARAIAIELAREKTKQERDAEVEKLKIDVAVLNRLNQETEKRLAEGTNQFKELDTKVDTTNNLLHEILGALKNRGLEIPDRTMNGGRPF